MSTIRTSLAIAGLIVGTVALGGCSTPTSADESASVRTPIDALEIAFFSPVATNTYTAANLRGVEAAAKEVGANVTLFDAAFDATKQVSQIQDALTTGRFDIFVVNPLNNAAVIPVAEQAMQQGVQVVSLMTTIGTDIGSLQSSVEGIITVGVPLGESGISIGGLIVEACADFDPCNVAYMPGDAAQATDQLRTRGVLEVLEKAPNITLVSEQPGGFDQASGLATMQNILTANPVLHVIAAASGQPIAGAMQAIEQAGRTGEILVVSNGGTAEDIEGIRNGSILGAPMGLPFSEGYRGVMLAIDALAGERVPTAVNVTEGSVVGPVATRETLSTPEGAAFEAEWTAG